MTTESVEETAKERACRHCGHVHDVHPRLARLRLCVCGCREDVPTELPEAAGVPPPE
jgi:hypothetical protein